jgi:hypothetical protein
MDAQQLHDDGLAMKLSAMTGDPAEEWDRAIAACRIARLPVDELERTVAEGWGDATAVRELVEGTFAYAGYQLGAAVRELVEAATPKWLTRMMAWLSR